MNYMIANTTNIEDLKKTCSNEQATKALDQFKSIKLNILNLFNKRLKFIFFVFLCFKGV